MHIKFFSCGAVLVLLLGLLMVPAPSVHAQSATTVAWSSSITYYTPSETEGTLMVCYYPEGGGAAVCSDAITLQPHKAGSLAIGNVGGLPASFAGSAVLYADVPILSANVQYAAGAEVNNYGRLLYSGFDESQSAETFYVPTMIYGGSTETDSMIGIQNVGTSDITATLKVYPVGSTTAAFEHDYQIPPDCSEIVAASEMGLAPVFSGSAVVSTVGGGEVVVAAQETQNAGRAAYAFEGSASGANTVYMASMLCNANGQTSYYAVQNVGSGSADVTIDFYDTAANVVGTPASFSIGEGSKQSINPCDSAVPDGTSGSAVITSVGAAVMAIGKVVSTDGMRTAWLGSASGATRVAAPYIRWAANPSTEWRSYVAVMNVGTGDATNIVARYYDATGVEVGNVVLADGTNPLPQYIKTNTNPSSAGVLDGSGSFGIYPYGGALEVESDQPIVVVVRVQKSVNFPPITRFAEDYCGAVVAP